MSSSIRRFRSLHKELVGSRERKKLTAPQDDDGGDNNSRTRAVGIIARGRAGRGASASATMATSTSSSTGKPRVAAGSGGGGKKPAPAATLLGASSNSKTVNEKNTVRSASNANTGIASKTKQRSRTDGTGHTESTSTTVSSKKRPMRSKPNPYESGGQTEGGAIISRNNDASVNRTRKRPKPDHDESDVKGGASRNNSMTTLTLSRRASTGPVAAAAAAAATAQKRKGLSVDSSSLSFGPAAAQKRKAQSAQSSLSFPSSSPSLSILESATSVPAPAPLPSTSSSSFSSSSQKKKKGSSRASANANDRPAAASSSSSSRLAKRPPEQQQRSTLELLFEEQQEKPTMHSKHCSKSDSPAATGSKRSKTILPAGTIVRVLDDDDDHDKDTPTLLGCDDNNDSLLLPSKSFTSKTQSTKKKEQSQLLQQQSPKTNAGGAALPSKGQAVVHAPSKGAPRSSSSHQSAGKQRVPKQQKQPSNHPTTSRDAQGMNGAQESSSAAGAAPNPPGTSLAGNNKSSEKNHICALEESQSRQKKTPSKVVNAGVPSKATILGSSSQKGRNHPIRQHQPNKPATQGTTLTVVVEESSGVAVAPTPAVTRPAVTSFQKLSAKDQAEPSRRAKTDSEVTSEVVEVRARPKAAQGTMSSQITNKHVQHQSKPASRDTRSIVHESSTGLAVASTPAATFPFKSDKKPTTKQHSQLPTPGFLPLQAAGASTQEEAPPKHGRPSRGGKIISKPDRIPPASQLPPVLPQVKDAPRRKRGRPPKVAENKIALLPPQVAPESVQPKRGPGRPIGSKSKPKPAPPASSRQMSSAAQQPRDDYNDSNPVTARRTRQRTRTPLPASGGLVTFNDEKGPGVERTPHRDFPARMTTVSPGTMVAGQMLDHFRRSRPSASPPTAVTSSKPVYMSCGRCSGCRLAIDCGRCLPCKQAINFSGLSVLKPVCVLRVCIAPILKMVQQAEDAESLNGDADSFVEGDLSDMSV